MILVLLHKRLRHLDLTQSQLPESDGTKAVRYEKLIPVLIEAIKELKAEIDILKKMTTTPSGTISATDIINEFGNSNSNGGMSLGAYRFQSNPNNRFLNI